MRTARALAPALVLALMTAGAQAATITVTTTAGAAGADGGCALREAILNANADTSTEADCAAGTGADDITFAAGLSGTVTLASALPSITGTLTLDGPGEDVLTISGGGAHRPLDVDVGATVSVSGLTVANGSSTTGGGMENDGTLVLDGVSVTGSDADWGGGIVNRADATLVLDTVTITGNTATIAGGIHNEGSLTVRDSTITGNTASGGGGGIVNTGDGGLLVTGTTISGNSAGSPSTGGGGISNSATATVVNSTVSGNTATYQGGGIRNLETLTVANSTLAGNSGEPLQGGGISSPIGTTTVTSSIVAGSPAGGDCAGTVTFTASLVQDGSCGAGGGAGNLAGDPLLGPLQDNGGATLTRALLPGSPAIDAGSNPDALVADQRGPGFPRTIGAATDIGAVETDSAGPVLAALSPADGTTDVALDADLVATFDEPIALGASGEITIRRAGDAGPVATADVAAPGATLSVVGDTLTFDPGVPLQRATGYYVTIDAGAVEDLAGNPFPGIAEATAWSFATAATPSPATPDPGPSPGPAGPPADTPPAGAPVTPGPGAGPGTPQRPSARPLVRRGAGRLTSAAAARRFVAERRKAGDLWIAVGRVVVDVPPAMERLRALRAILVDSRAGGLRSAARMRRAGRVSVVRRAGSHWVVISGSAPGRSSRAG